MPTYPPIQVVDENDQPIGGATMQDAYNQGLTHRIVYVIVTDPEGRILLQKRGPHVYTSPNCWDISVGGHVDEGEEYEHAAKREMAEELGLKDLELMPLEKFYQEDLTDKFKMKRFNMVYEAVIAPDAEITPAPEEITEVKWAGITEIKKMIEDHPEQVANGLVSCIKQYY